MKLIWAAIGVLVLTFLAMLGTGYLLPVRRAAVRSKHFDASAEQVWTIVDGPPDWMPNVRKYHALPPAGVYRRWEVTSPAGNSLVLAITEEKAPARLATRLDGKNLPYARSWIYQIAGNADGCTVTITETREIDSPLLRFISRFILGSGAAADEQMNAIERKLNEKRGIG